jgi:hypothetical protein
MPAGSPGIEVDGWREVYNVLLFKADGTSGVFATF